MNLTAAIARRQELVSIVLALIAKRVTPTTDLSGTSGHNAASLVSDAFLIQAQLDGLFQSE